VPAFILFGYYFAIMKLYALFTLHEVRSPLSLPPHFSSHFFSRQTGWGTRAGIGDPMQATAAANGSSEKLSGNSSSQYRDSPVATPLYQQHQTAAHVRSRPSVSGSAGGRAGSGYISSPIEMRAGHAR
jgi:hypothetical protein